MKEKWFELGVNIEAAGCELRLHEIRFIQKFVADPDLEIVNRVLQLNYFNS